MSKVFWDESFSVGVASLDSQHRSILCLLNDLDDIKDNDPQGRLHLRKILQLIEYHVDAHFMYEETLLRFVNYPDLQGHAILHLEMQSMIWVAVSISLHEDNQDVAELFNFAQPWWIDHILNHDKYYVSAIFDSELFLAAA